VELARFAETLLPLMHDKPQEAVSMANAAVAGFADTCRRHWLAGMRAKLGLHNQEEEDGALVEGLLDCMYRNKADFTNTFRDLASDGTPEASLFRAPDFQQWFDRWQARLQRQPATTEESRRLMTRSNPAVIPRNHRVEEALAAAVERADYTVMENLLAVLATPFRNPPEEAGYHLPPPPSEPPYRTFCGT
jgi:uncharacterized protein YdiU (UPF0061 family)